MSGGSPFDLPIATYRLQLSGAFTFDQASEIVPYLARLGISHVYSSPFLKARPGSTHGYDVVDYNQLNPELGDDAGFERFCAALDAHGMGLILDFVPNHMGVGKADNPWWLDVLEWGQASPYGRYFDIDWAPAKRALHDKLLVPVLGQSYGAALAAGEIALRFCAAEGTLDFWHYEHRLPLSPRDYAIVIRPNVDDVSLGAALTRLEDAVLAEADATHIRSIAGAAKQALAEAARSDKTARIIAESLARYQGRVGEPESFTALHELLERQPYRLAHWHSAADDINYRRFFDIGDLAGIRMEDIGVFRHAHDLVGRLLAAGRIQGLRVDHVDGLADPERYCRRLNAFAAAIVPRTADGRRLRPYILVEKILAAGETLCSSWPVAGTTGYDHLALVNGLFIDPTGYARLKLDWQRFTGHTVDLDEEIYRCRRLIMDRHLASELTSLVNWLGEIAEADWFTRDFTGERLRDALTEIVAAFAIYRTYVTPRGAGAEDRRRIAQAISDARMRWTGADAEILDFIGSLLTLDIAAASPDHYARSRPAIVRFVARFQQYTSAIAAKAVEDTAFYRHIPLASANEVGSDPHSPATSAQAFHIRMIEQQRAWPHALLASSTHDTKRGEDMRVRLDVLSEMPDEWRRRVARWHIYNRSRARTIDGAAAPTLNDEYLLYQTVVGTWPMRIGSIFSSPTQHHDYVERLKAYALKASREAKISTSWTMPNEAYEQALSDFIDGIFADPTRNSFLASVARFLPPVLRLGAINAITQLVLKTTLPGVPDFYQGSEIWDLSMVDPDNRRPVDFGARARTLEALATTGLAQARERWRDGWLKLFIAHRLLAVRNRFPDLFRFGDYRPLVIEGEAAEHVLAFGRRWQDAEIVVVVCRLLATKMRGDGSSFWPHGALFGESPIIGVTSRRWSDIVSGVEVRPCSRGFATSEVLSALPVAVLLSD
jgi:(1->4)-alpha-D-glucan 1-alpha-D-glucosylmutase